MTSTSQRSHQSAFSPYPNPRTSNGWKQNNTAVLSVPGAQQHWVSKSRRNSNQFHVMNGPTGTTGHYSSVKAQPETRADLALQCIPAPGVDSHLSSSTVFETGMTTSGVHTSHTGQAQGARSRHGRKGSNTGRVHLLSSMNASQVERGLDRSKRRSTTRHSAAVRHSTDGANNHMTTTTTSTPAATQSNVDTSLFWNSGRNIGGYHPGNNAIPETRPVQSPYTHDAGGADMAYHQAAPPEGTGTGFVSSGIQASEHPLSADIGAARHYSPNNSPYSTLGSLQPQPAPTIADQSISENTISGHANTIEYPYPTRYAHPQDNVEYMMSFSHQDNHLSVSQSPPAPFPQPLVGYDSGYHSAEPFYLTPNSPPSATLPIPSSRFYGPYSSTGASPEHVALDSPEKVYMLYQSSQAPVHSQPFIASPLHPSPAPSDNTSEGDRAVSPLTTRRANNIRHPGQRVDVDQLFLDGSFNENDESSRVRRAILNDIQRQPWFLNHEKEPQIESRNDPFSRGLGTVGRSIYTVFLVEDKESNQWRCLFGGDNNVCKKAEKRFERVERAIEHIRSHLGHRPFACDGTCLKSQTTNTPCGKRFFASGYLEDHKKRPQKRTSSTQH